MTDLAAVAEEAAHLVQVDETASLVVIHASTLAQANELFALITPLVPGQAYRGRRITYAQRHLAVYATPSTDAPRGWRRVVVTRLLQTWRIWL